MKNPLKQLPARGIMVGLFLLFTVPFGVVVHGLVAEINTRIEFAAKERQGLRYTNALRDLLEHLIQHQQLAQAYRPGDQTRLQAILSQNTTVDVSIQQIDKIDQELGKTLNTTNRWKGIKVHWQQFKHGLTTRSPETNRVLHDAFMNDLLTLVVHVGDQSNLILDPDLDSYYLMDAVITQLPNMLRGSAQMRTIGNTIATEQQIATEQERGTIRAQVLGLQNSIQSPLKAIHRGTQVAFDYNSALFPKLKASTLDVTLHTNAFLELINRVILTRKTVKPEEFTTLGNQAIASQFNLYDAMVPALDQLLQTRITKFTHRQQQVQLFGLFVLLTLLSTLIAFSRNLKRRQQSEITLREAEQKYRSIFENAADGIFQTTPDGVYIGANPALVKIYGYDSPEALMMALSRNIDRQLYVDPNRRAQFSQLLEQQDTITDFESQVYRQDGKIIWITENARAVRNPQGELLYYEGTVKDVSDRKRMEAALQASEAELRALVTAMTDVIIVYDREGRCQKVAPTSPTDQLVKPVAEQINQTVYENLPRVQAELQHQSILKVLDTGQAITGVEYSLTIDGQERWFSANVSPLSEDTILWVARDITDGKHNEVALKQAVEAAESANQYKSIFLANMSHELRTPLNIILGFTQLMIRDGSLNPKQHDQLSTINRSGEHLLTLINDVLEMSKIEAGRVTLNDTDFDLYDLLDWLLQMFQFKTQSKGLQFTTERADNLPEYIRTDESKLRQVLVNLLSNAVKFTQEGGVALRVKLAEAPHPLTLLFEVEDTGTGMAADDLERLFKPFVQTDSGHKSQEGTGLGLAISQKFVNLMGGKITVSSRIGYGSLFRFTIQVLAVEMGGRKDSAITQQIVGLAAGQPTYRILVVDDKLENRRLLVELLVPVGFEVQEAENGEDAIAQWETWNPDLIWMDVRMPVMNGYEATRQIKTACATANRTSPIIIALTGSVFEEDRKVALEMGCSDFMRKPFRAEELFEKMTKHLGVQYAYTGEQESQTTRVQSEPGSILPSSPLTAADLAVMPTNWVEQLHQAATKVNAKLVLNLVEQIPSTHSYLAHALNRLVDDFCFEEIVELAQQGCVAKMIE